jgi:S1-C subfamily serine protease
MCLHDLHSRQLLGARGGYGVGGGSSGRGSAAAAAESALGGVVVEAVVPGSGAAQAGLR